MIGRAGRQNFDTKGVGIILCAKDDERRFDNLVNSKTLLESSLHKNLVEHLNSEINLVGARFVE
jgi:ATP-dependent DNA helicase HFM1/MER3